MAHSKYQLRSQLNDAGGDTLDAAPHHSERGGANVEIHGRGIGVVVLQQVEKLRAKLERLIFLEADRLIHREIDILDSRQADSPGARRSTEAAEWSLDKRRGIKP